MSVGLAMHGSNTYTPHHRSAAISVTLNVPLSGFVALLHCDHFQPYPVKCVACIGNANHSMLHPHLVPNCHNGCNAVVFKPARHF